MKMQRYLEPEDSSLARLRVHERQVALRSRFRDTMRSRAQNKLLEPLEDNLHDVTDKTVD